MASDKARLFFALPVPDTTAKEIVKWCQTLPLNKKVRLVPAQNLHVTLAFIGDHPRSDIADLIEYTATLIHPADIRCHWRINKLDHFRSGILYTGGWTVPPQIMHMASELSFFVPANEHHRRFVPHMTLARNAERPADVPTFEFDLYFDRVVLFESLKGQGGVRYQPVHEWLASE